MLFFLSILLQIFLLRLLFSVLFRTFRSGRPDDGGKEGDYGRTDDSGWTRYEGTWEFDSDDPRRSSGNAGGSSGSGGYGGYRGYGGYGGYGGNGYPFQPVAMSPETMPRQATVVTEPLLPHPSRRTGRCSHQAAPEAAGRMTNRQKGSAGPPSATLPMTP